MGVDCNILGNSGPGHVIEHDGVAYRIGLIDQKAKAEFEESLFRRAVKAAEILARCKPAGWLEKTLAECNDAFMAGEFGLLTERGLKVLQTPGGVQLLLSILTGRDVVELVPVITAKKDQVKALIHLVIRESFPGVKIVESDPN